MRAFLLIYICFMWMVVSSGENTNGSTTTSATASSNTSTINSTISPSISTINLNTSSSIATTTTPPVSGAVQNLSLSSSFPSSPLSVSWNTPSIPNGPIYQYFILVSNTNNPCVLYITLNCTDCTNTTLPVNSTWPDNSTPRCDPATSGTTSVTTFLTSQASFAIVTNDSRIRPYTNYNVIVTAYNGYGWGNSSMTTTQTGQYISGPVTNLSVNSNFPSDNLQLVWSPPATPNGLISHYLISINSPMINCTLNVTSSSFSCDPGSTARKYNTSDPNFNVSISNTMIKPLMNVTITLIPLNGFGRGESATRTITTINYCPSPVSNLSSTVTYSSINISWIAPVVHSSIYSYNIKIYNQSNYQSYYSLSSQNSKTEFSSLESCSNYSTCVQVIDEYNSNCNSTCISSTTNPIYVTILQINPSVYQNNIYLSWNTSYTSNCLICFDIAINGTLNGTAVSPRYNLTGLQFITMYVFRITPTICNGLTTGLSSTINVTTAPDVVSNFNCINSSYNSMLVTWTPLFDPRGTKVFYYLRCWDNSPVDIYAGNVTESPVNVTNGVKPEIQYTCQLFPQTDLGRGSYSYCNLTIEPPPGSPPLDPIKLTSTLNTEGSVDNKKTKISITLPCSLFTNNFGKIRNFAVVVGRGSNITESGRLTTGYKDKTYSSCKNENNCVFEIGVSCPLKSRRKRAALEDGSPWNDTPFVIGGNTTCSSEDYSCSGSLASNTVFIIGFRVYTGTGFWTYGFIPKRTEYDPTAVVASLVTIILILVAVVGVLVYLKVRRNRRLPPEADTIHVFSSMGDSKSVRVMDFHNHYDLMKKDCNGAMVEEYQDIKTAARKMETEGKLVYVEGNETKNRYNNIRPYKHNLVTLQCDSNNYINASRICTNCLSYKLDKPCLCSNVYIATQGPIGEGKENKSSTISDFWRMVFENNVALIINLTRCEESGKEKCSQYWPEKIHSSMKCSSNDETIEVVLENVSSNSVFEEREFSITMNGQAKSVVQLHMTVWLDHGCPKTSDFLIFYYRYESLKKYNRPIVVHCSAGVGRTGTFILIDRELSRISKTTDKIDIYNSLLDLRKCRCLMVQTESQYFFVYAVIHEYLIQKGFIKPAGAPSDAKTKQSYENPIFNGD